MNMQHYYKTTDKQINICPAMFFHLANHSGGSMFGWAASKRGKPISERMDAKINMNFQDPFCGVSSKGLRLKQQNGLAF